MKNIFIKKADFIIGLSIFFLTIPIFMWVIYKANTDLAMGRYALFYDEWITFDGVKSILRPLNIFDFIQNIIDGIYLYGRSLMYINSIFSFIPEIIWGDSGIIMSNRFFQAIILHITYLILCLYFIKSWIIRSICFCLFSSLPSTVYYSSMPKPEPLQFLFLTMFLIHLIKNNFKFGYYWFFLGLSFGLKISIAPLILLTFGFSYVMEKESYFVFTKKYFTRENLLKLKSLFWPASFIVAVHSIILGLILLGKGEGLCPYFCGYSINKLREYFTLTKPFILILIGWFSIASGVSIISLYFLQKKYYLNSSRIIDKIIPRFSVIIWTIFHFSAGFVISNPGVLLKFPIGAMIWFRSTFFTSNISDSSEVNFFSWIKFIPQYLDVSDTSFYFFVVINMALMIAYINYHPLKDLSKLQKIQFVRPLIIMFFGCSLCLPIMIKVQRLWGMYLHIGISLIILSNLIISEFLLIKKKKFYFSSVLSVIALSLCTLFTFGRSMPSAIDSYSSLSERTQNEAFIAKKKEYDAITKFLKITSLKLNRKISVLYDSRLFVPDSNLYFESRSFWQYLIPWERDVDFVVALKDNYNFDSLQSNKTIEYKNAMKSFKKKENYVDSTCKTCKKISYSRLTFNHKHIEIFKNNRLSKEFINFAVKFGSK